MKGIIVKSRIAGKEDMTMVAIPNGVATAALTISRNEEVVWGIGAMTMPEGKSLSWNGGKMGVGDSISLKFTDVNEPSQPLSQEFMADCMKKAATEGDDSREWDFKLKRYQRLKVFFEDKHVI